MTIRKNSIFVFGDGDNIRHRVESLLFDNKLTELREFSNKLKTTILEIENMVVKNLNASVIVAGGDDIIFVIDAKDYDMKYFEELMFYFQSATGCTLSLGIGLNLEMAYLNLLRAKATGKAKLTDTGLQSPS